MNTKNLNEMSNADLVALIQQMQLKQNKPKEITAKVSTKGALSIYGLGRWPVTLYASQWKRLLAHVDYVNQALEVNKSNLTEKE